MGALYVEAAGTQKPPAPPCKEPAETLTDGLADPPDRLPSPPASHEAPELS